MTCGLGPYNFEFMTEVHKEIMSRYRVEGIFLNRWDGSGECYCEHCRANFKAASGFDLPRTDDPHDPVRRAYILWRQQRLFSLLAALEHGNPENQSRLLHDSQQRQRRARLRSTRCRSAR